MYSLKYFDINNYTEAQIQTARAAALEDAIALWTEKDCETYKAIQEILIALLQAFRWNEVSMPLSSSCAFSTPILEDGFRMGIPIADFSLRSYQRTDFSRYTMAAGVRPCILEADT